MSLKWKLFLFFGSLMAVLMVTQWWLVRRISANTVEEFANATADISQQMVEFFNQQLKDSEKIGETVRVIRTDETETIERFALPGGEPVPEVAAGQHRLEVKDFRIKSTTLAEDRGLDGEPSTRRLETRFEMGRTEEGDPLPGRNARIFAIRVAGPGTEKEISVSSSQLQASMAEFRTQLFLGTGLILIVGLAAAGLLSNRTSRPLRELSAASAEIAAGNWGKQVESAGTAELETAIDAFNRMSRELQSYARAQETWQQERHLSELGEVARSLAHTIRNPLNALGLCLEELGSRSSEPAHSEELVGAGRYQIQRIDQWIRSFLSLASQPETLIETVSWEPLIEDIVLELAQTQGPHSVEIGPDLAQLPPVKGSEAELRGMLQTLLANAVEASPPDMPIHLRGRVSGSHVVIEIIDQGEGLSREVRENLFSQHVTTKVNGSGMGLYLTRQIATTRYQGNLELEDHAPRGTRARLTLGLERVSGGRSA